MSLSLYYQILNGQNSLFESNTVLAKTLNTDQLVRHNWLNSSTLLKTLNTFCGSKMWTQLKLDCHNLHIATLSSTHMYLVMWSELGRIKFSSQLVHMHLQWVDTQRDRGGSVCVKVVWRGGRGHDPQELSLWIRELQ